MLSDSELKEMLQEMEMKGRKEKEVEGDDDGGEENEEDERDTEDFGERSNWDLEVEENMKYFGRISKDEDAFLYFEIEENMEYFGRISKETESYEDEEIFHSSEDKDQ